METCGRSRPSAGPHEPGRIGVALSPASSASRNEPDRLRIARRRIANFLRPVYCAADAGKQRPNYMGKDARERPTAPSTRLTGPLAAITFL